MTKRIIIPLLALLLAIAVLANWTGGFQSFTIFSYTLQKAGNIPRDFRDISLVDQDNKVFQLADKHKYLLVNFVYLNCPSVCHKVNNRLEKIYHSIHPQWVPSQLEFVTISFDPANDDVEKIKKYRSYFGNNIDGWTFALPHASTTAQFQEYLKQVGIWAYPAPATGIINHSIYIFLVSPDNQIIRVFDPAREDDLAISEGAMSCIKQNLISSSH